MEQSGDLIRLVIPQDQFPENGFISRRFGRSGIIIVEVPRPGSPDIGDDLQIDLDAVLVDDDENAHRVGRVRQKHRLPVAVDQLFHLLRVARNTDIHIRVRRCGSFLKRPAEPDVDLMIHGKFRDVLNVVFLVQHGSLLKAVRLRSVTASKDS